MLVAAGALCLAWVAYHALNAAVYRERHINSVSAEVSASPIVSTAPVSLDNPDDGVGPDGVVGVLEIPRLGVSEVIAAGDGDATLDVAIGHLSDTPLPWTMGNSVLAAHRDTHFRALRHVEFGDLIRLKTRKGVFEYYVRDRMIVDPDDVWVMAPSAGRRLTLVTCYPFTFVGPAPQRFIVRADAR